MEDLKYPKVMTVYVDMENRCVQRTHPPGFEMLFPIHENNGDAFIVNWPQCVQRLGDMRVMMVEVEEVSHAGAEA